MVSKKAISFLQEIEEFKSSFKTFETDQQAKWQNLPVFKKGVDFYQFQLNFNFINIIQELDVDILRIKFVKE